MTKLTLEQILAARMIQFANEYHRQKAFRLSKETLAVVLKHRVEDTIAILKKEGYLKENEP